MGRENQKISPGLLTQNTARSPHERPGTHAYLMPIGNSLDQFLHGERWGKTENTLAITLCSLGCVNVRVGMYRTPVSAGGAGWASVSVIAQQDLASCVKESSTAGETHTYPYITTLWDHCPPLHEIDFFYRIREWKTRGWFCGTAAFIVF